MNRPSIIHVLSTEFGEFRVDDVLKVSLEGGTHNYGRLSLFGTDTLHLDVSDVYKSEVKVFSYSKIEKIELGGVNN